MLSCCVLHVQAWGQTTDQMIMLALQPNSQNLAFLNGCAMLPILPGRAAECAPCHAALRVWYKHCAEDLSRTLQPLVTAWALCCRLSPICLDVPSLQAGIRAGETAVMQTIGARLHQQPQVDALYQDAGFEANGMEPVAYRR